MKTNVCYLGDCLDVLKTLPENSVDSIVTDPPYHLASIVKRFGKEGSAPAKFGTDGAFKRASTGFMGKTWDGGDIAFNPEMWKECLRVLKPGGHLLSFSGTRTYHRMAVAIEDAGFEVRDMIEWIYGSGFPKSLNIGKAVDKLQGNEREVVGSKKGQGSIPNDRGNWGLKPNEDVIVDKGNSEWEGWGTALKPAHEPICMARKPLAEKTVAENVLKYGTGGINIDDSRVDFVSEEDRKESTTKNQHADFGTKPMTNNNVYGDYSMIEPKNFNPTGRFPANLIHDNSEEVRECFPDVKGSKGSGLTQTKARSWKNTSIAGINRVGYEDNGNASRFFKSIIYQAKASKSERNKGMDNLEAKKGGAMVANTGKVMGLGGASLKGEHKEIENVKNSHPTVKPIALMSYLIKMITPKGGITLDPFAGSGSTLVAAKDNGFQYIGIEITEEYLPIIQARTGCEIIKEI